MGLNDGGGRPNPFRDRPASLCGGVMIRISLSYFHELGALFQRVRLIQPGANLNDVWNEFYAAERAILTLLSSSVYSASIRTSRASASNAVTQLRALTAIDFTQGDRALTFAEVGNVTYALNNFETIFKAEIESADAYFVAPKRGYDTLSLISQGEIIWSPELTSKAPEALFDAREASKCIAFELGTAAGFHIMRAVEAVLLRYWDFASGKKPLPANRNLGNYLKQMEEKGYGDAKVVAALKQIKDLHRNGLMHPQDKLTVEEAIELLGICQSAVSAMLKPMPDAHLAEADHPPTPGEPTPSGDGPERIA